MTDYRELEERLRAKPTFENAREAADAIKALREENERLREALYVCMPYLRNRYPALSLTASKEGGVSPPTAPRDGESKIEAFRFIVRRA
jgi:hypothetical protein